VNPLEGLTASSLEAHDLPFKEASVTAGPFDCRVLNFMMTDRFPFLQPGCTDDQSIDDASILAGSLKKRAERIVFD
jgi:hypothetical protein